MNTSDWGVENILFFCARAYLLFQIYKMYIVVVQPNHDFFYHHFTKNDHKKLLFFSGKNQKMEKRVQINQKKRQLLFYIQHTMQKIVAKYYLGWWQCYFIFFGNKQVQNKKEFWRGGKNACFATCKSNYYVFQFFKPP